MKKQLYKMEGKVAYYDDGKSFLVIAIAPKAFAFSKDEKDVMTIMRAKEKGEGKVRIVPCVIEFEKYHIL